MPALPQMRPIIQHPHAAADLMLEAPLARALLNRRVRAGTMAFMSLPAGSMPSVMKSSASKSNSWLTMCSVACIKPLQALWAQR